MKVRSGFVSNSSSSSFLLAMDKEMTYEDKYKFLMDIIPDDIKNIVEPESLKSNSLFVKTFCKELNVHTEFSDTFDYLENKRNEIEEDLEKKRINYHSVISLPNGNYMYVTNKNFNKIKHYFNKICPKHWHQISYSFKNVWKQHKKILEQQLKEVIELTEKLYLTLYDGDHLYFIDMPGSGNGGALYMDTKQNTVDYGEIIWLRDLWLRNKFTEEFNKRIVEVEEG